MTKNKELGDFGEKLITDYYLSNGYTLLAQNYISRYGEIDIVVQKENTIVFSEVKLRKVDAKVSGAEAVDFHKQQRIAKSALFFMNERHLHDELIRFDVAIVTHKDDRFDIQVIENAFQVDENLF